MHFGLGWTGPCAISPLSQHIQLLSGLFSGVFFCFTWCCLMHALIHYPLQTPPSPSNMNWTVVREGGASAVGTIVSVSRAHFLLSW